MPSKPVVPLFFSDLVGDTLHLSASEFGSYMLLLGAMWNAGGYLPNDQNKLRRIARCDRRRWAATWATLIPYFVFSDRGVESPRLTREWDRVEAISEERRVAGIAGNVARWDPKARPKRRPD